MLYIYVPHKIFSMCFVLYIPVYLALDICVVVIYAVLLVSMLCFSLSTNSLFKFEILLHHVLWLYDQYVVISCSNCLCLGKSYAFSREIVPKNELYYYN